MKYYKYKKLVLSFAFTLISFVLGLRVLAQGIVPENGKATGNYHLNDMVLVAVNVAKWALMVSGALALLAFVVGGFMFILSAGNKEWVEKGKASLKGATIGLFVVLLAYTLVDFFMKEMGYDSASFGGEWNKTN